MLHANFMAVSSIEPEALPIEFYFVGIGIFDLFGSCDLDLDPMTFIYEHDLYPLEMYRMSDVLRQGFRKLSSDRQTYRHTDRLTDKTEIIYHVASRVVKKL